MRGRFAATLATDVRLQIRNGFYTATAVVLVVWIGLVAALPAVDLGWLLPAIVLGNLVVNTFYFIAGMVLLERDEGTLEARVVTPLRSGEYIGAKVLSLVALALAENLLVVILLHGIGFNVLAMSLSIVLGGAIFALAGFVAVARYASINEFLMPSAVYTAVLELPLLAYLARWDHWIVGLHPLYAPLVLAKAAFTPAPLTAWLFGVGVSALWIAIGVIAAKRAFRRFVIGAAGGEA